MVAGNDPLRFSNAITSTLMKSLTCTALFVAFINTAAIGAVSYTTYGATVSQNFDSLATTGTANTWANDVTLTGWHLFRQPAGTPVALTTYSTGTGSSNAGNFYSFGPAANSDRALGGLGSAGLYFGSPAAGNALRPRPACVPRSRR